MSFDDEFDSGLSDDEESDEYRDFKIGRTGIIFLIDSRQHMLQQNRDGNVHFRTCIEVSKI